MLNIPTSKLETLVLEIGSCSGKDGINKYEMLKIQRTDFENNFFGVNCDGIAGYLCCKVMKVIDDHNPSHVLLICTILSAEVDERFWNGKQFLPSIDCFLSFLGTKKFAYVGLNANR